MNTWQQQAAALVAEQRIEYRAFINGHYQQSQHDLRFSCVNPSTEQQIARITQCTQYEVEQAVAAARAAFESGIWSGLAPRERGRILQDFAALIRAHSDELAVLESINMGKPITDAQGDIEASAYAVAWYGQAIDKITGEVAAVDPAYVGLVTREPVGVVAAIVPWNFPLLMASWKFAPALAAGNAVILKPSEKSPLTAIKVAKLAQQAGIPDGIFQVLPGAGEVGQALALHEDIDCVAFTGSTAVGKAIAGYAASSNLKRVWLELGGKSANIIFDDCADIQAAACSAAAAIFYNAGQMCSAGSRVLVQQGIKQAFIDALLAQAQVYVAASPLEESCRLGPIVDAQQQSKIMNYIASGRKNATLLCGGESTQVDGKGYFIQPTVFIDVAADADIAREEIFGPVLSLLSFTSEDQAISLANSSEYGLGAGVWTASINRAHRVSRRLRAGTVWVNCYEEGEDMNMPFGGYKLSGNGRDKSLHALEKYTELKSTLIKLS